MGGGAEVELSSIKPLEALVILPINAREPFAIVGLADKVEFDGDAESIHKVIQMHGPYLKLGKYTLEQVNDQTRRFHVKEGGTYHFYSSTILEGVLRGYKFSPDEISNALDYVNELFAEDVSRMAKLNLSQV